MTAAQLPGGVVCERRKHELATVTEEAGELWLDIPRWGARPQNGWKGTPKRVRLERPGRFEHVGSADRVGCACRRWALLSHQQVLDAIERGDTRIVLY